MIRQELRFKIRETTKKLKKVEKTLEFKATRDFFASLKEEDYELLKANTHPDQKLTAVYKRYSDNLGYVVNLQKELHTLLALRKPHPNNL